VAWVDTAFRHVALTYNESLSLYGVNLFRFTIQHDQLLNASANPENAAYYMFLPSGMANLSAPYNGTPLYVSKPHFLDAAPCYFEQVVMTPPNRTLHETVLDIEPTTGATFNAKKRLQLNLYIRPILLLYPNLPEVYCPMVWIEEGGTITESLADQFKSNINTAMAVETWVGIGGKAVGALFLLIAIIAFIGVVVFSYKEREKGLTDEREPLTSKADIN